MAQRIPRPSSTPPSNNQPPGAPSDLGDQVDDAKKAVLFILKDTDWPKDVSNEVQNLIRNMQAPLALNKIPKEGTDTPEELANAIHQFLGHLESAQTRLKGESEKYGTKNKGFRKRVKVFFSRNDKSQCAAVVRSCRNEIVESWTTLNDILNSLEGQNEQPLSRAAGDDFKGPLGNHATPTASTSNPHANGRGDLTATSGPSSSARNQSFTRDNQGTSNGCRNDAENTSATPKTFLSKQDTANDQPPAQVTEDQASSDSRPPGTQIPTTLAPDATLGPATNLVQPSIPDLASAPRPEVSQVSSVGLGKEKGSSRRGELLNGANKVFKFAEGVSGALPVVGSYVGAVAKVGLTVVEMIQAMDDNDGAAEGLGAHVCRLSNILERFSNQPRQAETGQTASGMDELQQ
ncbi:hypothetical protein FS837_000772 [Tulasnella sp. UAMH 9824]|nr:hypothetical protein FS837_000772 [Tulasnella sp. UAMH 9824]